MIALRDPELRAAFRTALAGVADCSEAASPAAIFTLLDTLELPICCFVDAGPAGSGIRIVEQMLRTQPAAKGVLVAQQPTADEFLQAVRAGAAGYLPESLNPGRLPAILASVLRDKAAVPRELVQCLVEEVRGAGRRKLVIADGREVTLTAREAQVLELLRAGLPTHRIANRLGISHVTVRRHRSSLFAKLGIKSQNGLVNLSPTPSDK